MKTLGNQLYDMLNPQDPSAWANPAKWEQTDEDFRDHYDRVAKRFFDAVVDECAKIADNGMLVPPDGGSPTEDECRVAEDIAVGIRFLKVARSVPRLKSEATRSDEVDTASTSASLTLIKRLVQKLQDVEKDTEYQLHHPYAIRWPEPRILDSDKRCGCALCGGLELLHFSGIANDT